MCLCCGPAEDRLGCRASIQVNTVRVFTAKPMYIKIPEGTYVQNVQLCCNGHTNPVLHIYSVR